MPEEMTSQDLNERVALIETMIAEGRKQTQSWGWTFLLWGIAYYIAIVWAAWGQSLTILGRNTIAWPITMIAAAAITVVIAAIRPQQPGTRIGRAIGSLWMCLGISLLLLMLGLSISRRIEAHTFVAIVTAFLGFANGASGMILRWKAQMASAAVWWIASVAVCFTSDAELTGIFLGAIFLCQIVFGIYAMNLDARRSRPDGAVHA